MLCCAVLLFVRTKGDRESRVEASARTDSRKVVQVKRASEDGSNGQ